MSPTTIDHAFTERVRAALGEPACIEVTPGGRTVLRYRGFCVAPESGRPVAARMDEDRMRFAAVRPNGKLVWRNSRPTLASGSRPWRP